MTTPLARLHVYYRHDLAPPELCRNPIPNPQYLPLTDCQPLTYIMGQALKKGQPWLPVVALRGIEPRFRV